MWKLQVESKGSEMSSRSNAGPTRVIFSSFFYLYSKKLGVKIVSTWTEEVSDVFKPRIFIIKSDSLFYFETGT